MAIPKWMKRRIVQRKCCAANCIQDAEKQINVSPVHVEAIEIQGQTYFCTRCANRLQNGEAIVLPTKGKYKGVFVISDAFDVPANKLVAEVIWQRLQKDEYEILPTNVIAKVVPNEEDNKWKPNASE